MGCTQSSSATEENLTSNGEGGTNRKPVRKTALAPAEVDERIDIGPGTVKATFGGVTMRYASLSQRGFYPDAPNKANQDSYCVMEKYVDNESDAFFGVFDGHGETGDKCSQFVRDHLPRLISSGIREDPKMNQAQLNGILQEAHNKCNKKLHRSPKVDCNWSGTTSITVFFRGDLNEITVSNVGDSRAVMGSEQGRGEGGDDKKLTVSALSRDQVPFRRDERERIRNRGGRVLTEEQIFGKEKAMDSSAHSWKSGRGDMGEKVLGDEVDDSGQPPRVFSPHGDYPGLSVTRSLGDKVISCEGVVDAEPEILMRELNPKDKIIFVASDGVWEFLTNQQVMDMCSKYDDPLEACRAIQAESYRLWMKNDTRTDDITMICLFLDDVP